ncbi:ABC transporter substrate-binding protein [Microbacterium sp. A94]|uniref:ABC transporter substrate-binding protein n=1 Tax=Microbacterium sp. A94 TaxID=3450717 RepID=UPI003F438E22
MRTSQKRVAVGIVAALTISLAACSSPADGGDEQGAAGEIGADQSVGAMEDFAAGTTFKATEPVEFSLMYRDHPNYSVQEDWSVFKHLEEDNNVTFDRTDIPLADWDNKKSLLVGAGDASALIPVTYPGQETQFVSGGAVLPVSDYVQYMPNFEQKAKDWGLQDELDAHRQADGKYYLLPGVREIPDVQYSVVIREDLFEKAGITEDPETWEEFAEQLAEVTAANPDLSFAMSDRWTDSQPLGAMLQYIAPNYDTIAGWGYSNNRFDEASGEFQFTGTTDGYKELLEYAAGLVDAGLLDPEITQSDDQAIQKFVSGQTAAISGNTQEINSYRSKFADAGNTEASLKMVVLPGGPAGGYLTGSRLSSGVMISDDAKDNANFLAMLQFVDWLYYSDEGIEFAQWGVEGETFTKDADGKRELLPEIGWNALNPDAPKKLNADFGYSNGVFLLANGSSKDLLQSVMSDETREWTDQVLAVKEIVPVAPAAPLDEIELEQNSLLDTQLKDAVMAATAAFVTGQRSFDDWDAFVAEIDAQGGKQLIDTMNGALERAKSAN